MDVQIEESRKHVQMITRKEQATLMMIMRMNWHILMTIPVSLPILIFRGQLTSHML
jgi:TRAP-type uncharacterized transport system fused permease subunit